MKKISLLSFDLQHKLADAMISLGFRSGYAYKQRLDARLSFTLVGK